MKIKRNKLKGFTMMEVMVVSIILTIVFALGKFSVDKVRERSAQKEAVAALRLIVAAERGHRMNNGSFIACADTATCNTLLKIDLNSSNWEYSAAINSGIAEASAVRVNAGAYNCTFNTNTTSDTPIKGSCGAY